MHVLILNAHPSAALGATLQQIPASACFAHIDQFKQPIDRIHRLSELNNSIAEHIKAADLAFHPALCLSRSIIGIVVSRLIVAE